jgi:uncharacterized protein YlxW (UPF0749 family)
VVDDLLSLVRGRWHEAVAAARQQRARPHRPHGAWRTAVPVVTVAAGLLAALSANTSGGIDLRSRSTRLVDVVAERERSVTALEASVDRQRRQLAAETAAQAASDARIAALTESAAGLRAVAGLTPVSGPGLRVTLNDAPTTGHQDSTVDPNALVVHQQDVQSVVNALWAGGGTAMMIQDQRVVSTSAVRCVGNTLLLGGRVYSPPYVVTALGDPASLQRSLNAAPGVQVFRQYVDAYGLGFSSQRLSRANLPGYTGSTTLTVATPLPGSPFPTVAGSPTATPGGGQ